MSDWRDEAIEAERLQHPEWEKGADEESAEYQARMRVTANRLFSEVVANFTKDARAYREEHGLPEREDGKANLFD